MIKNCSERRMTTLGSIPISNFVLIDDDATETDVAASMTCVSRN